MNFGESIWYAKRTNSNAEENASYGVPVEIITAPNFFTCMSAESGGYLQYLKYGETLFETWNVNANARVFGHSFSEGDLFWVDGHKPNQEIEQKYGNGASANAIVDNISFGRFVISIVLRQNQKQVIEE